MPTQSWTVTAPNGKQFDLTGDHVPSEAELNDLFKAAGADTGSAPVFSKRGGMTNPAMVSPAGEPAPESTTATVARTALNALPGIGGIVGGVMSTPETLGTGTLLGVSLGAGAGRGLRDILTEAFGLEPKSSPASKGGRIALDVAETAVLGKVIPELINYAKHPLTTLGDVIDTLPKRIRPDLSPLYRSMPAKPIMERPAWQRLAQAVEPTTPVEPTPTTATSMVPAPQPVMTPRPAPPPPPAPPQATGTSFQPAPQPPMTVTSRTVAPPVQPVAASALSDIEFARAEVAAGRLPKSVLKSMEEFEARKLVRAQQATPPPVQAPPSTPPVATEPPVAAPVPAPVPVEPPAPVAPPAATAPAVEAPAARLSPAQVKNAVGQAVFRAKKANPDLKVSPAEMRELDKAVRAGLSVEDAVAVLVKKKTEAPAAEFAAKYGTPSDAERTFPPNKAGLPTKPPKVSDAARFDAARGKPQSPEIPPELVKSEPANQYATVAEPAETTPTAKAANPYDAAGAATELQRLRDMKPRPIDKMYGKNGPTPEQQAEWDAAMKDWNKKYRAASAKQKSELEKSNEWMRAHPSEPK